MSNRTITRVERARLVHAVHRYRHHRRECMQKHALAAQLLGLEPHDPDLTAILIGPVALPSQSHDDVDALLRKIGVAVEDPMTEEPQPMRGELLKAGDELLRRELLDALNRRRQP